MKYFTFPQPAEVTCMDGECPCPKEPLNAGSTYLFISNQVVKDRSNGTLPENAADPLVLCRDAVRRRDLDLEVAREDADHWRTTGSVALRSTPRREIKVKEFGGPSLEEAERIARSATGEGLLDVKPVRDVQERSVTAQGPNPEAAIEAVGTRLPEGAFDALPAEIVQEGQKGTVEISDWDERDARKAGRKQAPRGANLDSIELKTPPKKGVMGIGKAPGIWVAHWSAPYIAEIRFKMPAVVTARYFPG